MRFSMRLSRYVGGLNRMSEAYELVERLAEAALTLTALPSLIEEAQGD
jgi:hypothetical protein